MVADASAIAGASSDVTSSTLSTNVSRTENQKEPKQRTKKEKKKEKKPAQQNGQKSKPKSDKPFYQILGQELLASTRPANLYKALPPLPIEAIPIPSIPSSVMPSPVSEKQLRFPAVSVSELPNLSRPPTSYSVSRISEDSLYNGPTKIIQDQQRPEMKYRVKGTIYNLGDFDAMSQTESLIMRYGRVAHMGVRDPSYSFWMNKSRTAVVHFKVLNKVAVLGGDPLCHPARIALTMREFEQYCRKVGWKTAVIAGSENIAAIAKSHGWTSMHFGSETVLDPMTNEVLLGKSGKRIVTQCRQLLDPARGGQTIHSYCPSHGRDSDLEAGLTNIYEEWRNERNTNRDSQAFVTVFDLFAMHTLMTFLYTKDQSGSITGFAALRQLGAHSDTSSIPGYHIDPFIQTPTAPRGTSDLLIFAALSLLNAQGCTYLSLGFEPLAAVGSITGMPSALHGTTRKIYSHVFGKIPVGGKEAFFARWKPDMLQSEEQGKVYLVFVGGKVPSPRFMVAMTHYANISLRQILKEDLKELRGKVKGLNKDGSATTTTSSSSETEAVSTGDESGTKEEQQQQQQQKKEKK